MNKDKFNFFVSADVIEKGAKDKDGYPEEMIVRGIASTSDEDSDGETLEPSGYVLDRFLKSGYINLEHKSKDDFRYIIGEPTQAKIQNNKLWIEGKLYKTNPLAKSVYDTIRMLKAEGSNRKIGFSIEGKAIERDPNNPKRITKALLTNVAITQSAKNQNTWADIAKGDQTADYIENVNGGKTYLLDVTTDNGTRIVVDKDFKVKITPKAMGAGNGAPLMPESLGKKVKKLPEDFIKSMQTLSKACEKGKVLSRQKEIIKARVKKYFEN